MSNETKSVVEYWEKAQKMVDKAVAALLEGMVERSMLPPKWYNRSEIACIFLRLAADIASRSNDIDKKLFTEYAGEAYDAAAEPDADIAAAYDRLAKGTSAKA